MIRNANKSFKPLAKLARTSSTPHRIACGFAIFTQTALRTGRRLTGRYVQKVRGNSKSRIKVFPCSPLPLVSAEAR